MQRQKLSKDQKQERKQRQKESQLQRPLATTFSKNNLLKEN